MKKLNFASLLLLGLGAATAVASIPPTSKVTNDTAIYQNLSEITAPKQGKLSFDDDIQRLNKMESRYHEKLPRLADRPGIAGPLKRISMKKYKPTGRKGTKTVQQ